MLSVFLKKNSTNIFQRLHPLQRIVIGILLSLGVFLLIHHSGLNKLILLMVLWDVFSFSVIVMTWIVILTRSTLQIRNLCKQEDGSLVYVFTLILVSSFASMITVMLLMISRDVARTPEIVYLPIAVAGMIFSWVMVHTIFCIHYARLYYTDDLFDPRRHAGGLIFPGEDNPDYLDFAYFSFIIGMTFQVSDVQISGRVIRRMAMVHGLLSFVLNTFVVALTINLIAGLKK